MFALFLLVAELGGNAGFFGFRQYFALFGV